MVDNLIHRLPICHSFLNMVPEKYITAAVVDSVSQLILHSKEIMKRKLDYITIPELDVD